LTSATEGGIIVRSRTVAGRWKMTRADIVEVDPEMRALMEVVVRALVYITRWICRRYGLEHLVKSDSRPR